MRSSAMLDFVGLLTREQPPHPCLPRPFKGNTSHGFMSNMSDSASTATPVDIFRPPPKGDITLRSSDGEELQAHSTILCLASSIFGGLCVVGTNQDVIELSESTETISLLLQFIYPNKKTSMMTSFDMLYSCLLAAQKYDLEGMLEMLDEQLASKTGPRSLAHQDPLRAYKLSVQFNLPNTRRLVASLVSTSRTNFADPSRLAELIQPHPSTSVLHLTAIQSIRGKMFADIFLHFYTPPITLRYSNIFFKLLYNVCQSSVAQLQSSNLANNSPPSWLLAWIKLAYVTLLQASLETSNHLFD